MRTFRVGSGLAGLAILAVAGAAPGAPIDLEGRRVPFSIRAAGDLTSPSIRLGAKAAASLTVSVTLEPGDAQRSFGLFVPHVHDASVVINGRRLELEPVFRKDGAVFAIPAGLLREGENEVTISRQPKVSTAASWSQTALFSLEEVEEMHFGLAFADALVAPADSEPPTADQQKYDALWYDLYIEPDLLAPVLNSGVRNLSSHITSATLTMGGRNISGSSLASVVLDFDRNSDRNADASPLSPTGLNVLSVDTGAGTPAIAGYTHNDATNKLTIPLPAPVAPGAEFQVRVAYSGYPNVRYTTPGGHNQIAQAYTGATHGSGQPVIYTANQPFGARRWFPCKDVPADKATTTTIRVRIPFVDSNLDSRNDYGTMSNGLLTAKIFEPELNTETHVWESSYPIPTYLMAFYASNYQYSEGELHTNLDGTTIPILHAIYPENAAYEGNAAGGTRTILNTYRQLFGEYPFKREKYGTASWNITFGVENQNATGMPSGLSGNTLGNGLTDRNIHEIAHQWWGDNVTYTDFDHLWLGEGFATHAEALFREFRPGGSFAAYKERMAFYYASAVASPTKPLVHSSGEAVLDNTFYRRGAWVVHMLRRVLGDETFFQVAKTYHASLAGTSTDSAGFQAVAEAVSGRDLDWFFNQWLYRTNQASARTFPRYRYEADLARSSGGDYLLRLKVDQVQGGTAGNAFVMPLDFRVTDGVNPATVTVQNSDYSQTYEIPLGTTLPLEIDFDPDEWVLKIAELNIATVALPPAVAGQPYSQALRATGPGAPYSWSGSGLPPGLTVSSGGVVSGTAPTAPGIYQFQVTVEGTRTGTIQLEVASAEGPAPVVINEVYYDRRPNPDSGEYIELKNRSAAPVDISGWTVVLVNGSTGTSYAPGPIGIPASTVLPAGGYYLIGNVPGADLPVSLDGLLQDGAPDAIVLRDAANGRVDSLCYEADAAFAGSGTDRAHAIAEGGTGAVVSTIFGASDNAVLGRLPDGADTNNNLADFACMAPSPGAANTNSVTLPFADNFDSGAHPAWRTGFTSIRTVAPGSPLPPASPQGGAMLEVIDRTGGGDVAYLAGAFDRINLQGYLWIPATVASGGWSTGVGVATRNESTWFSPFSGNAMESGYYLEYQNGPLGVSSLKGGSLPAEAGVLRLLAVDSLPTLGTGPGTAVVTELGRTSVTPNAWLQFRLAFDGNGGKVGAYVGGSPTPFAVSSIPLGGSSRAGGVVIGFREEHADIAGQVTAPNEGTWVDAITVDTNVGPDVPVRLGEFAVE